MTEFTHIHCSSRFDRSAALLETDLDSWMAVSDLVTLTEVTNDRRAATLAEKGWGYYNSKRDDGSDQCGIAWDNAVFVRKKLLTVRLENVRFKTLTHHNAQFIYAINLLLGHRTTKETLMVSVTHFPADVQGRGQLAPAHDQTAAEWRARKLAYTTSMTNWSNSVKARVTAWKPDNLLCVADWNLDLKQGWVRHYIDDHWKQVTGIRQAWNPPYPTMGTSINGGSRIIDGALYLGMQLSAKPVILPAVRSSDHRPFKETFLLSATESDPAAFEYTGSVMGDPWWGFGDYRIDEIYLDPDKYYATGERGGEVL